MPAFGGSGDVGIGELGDTGFGRIVESDGGQGGVVFSDASSQPGAETGTSALSLPAAFATTAGPPIGWAETRPASPWPVQWLGSPYAS